MTRGIHGYTLEVDFVSLEMKVGLGAEMTAVAAAAAHTNSGWAALRRSIYEVELLEE